MERLAELLFELSNYDRLEILYALVQNEMKLTQISKTLDLTAQETSRHLTRLSTSNLVDKRASGDYYPTELCKQILELLPGFTFLFSNREYFLEHSLRTLPRSFTHRIGELAESELFSNAIKLFQMVDSLIIEANEFVWILADQALSSTFPLLIDALERGVEFRTILPTQLGPPLLPPEALPDFSKFMTTSMRIKHLEVVELVVILSERRGIVTFPTLDGRMDYCGFVVHDDEGIGWCKDLFLQAWETATDI